MKMQPNSSSLIKQYGLRNRPAWIVVGTFIFFVVALLFIGGAASILSLLFPIGALAVGIFLHERYPIYYVSFAIWLSLVSNVVTRVNGYHLGGLGPFGSAFLLVPFLTIFTFIKHLPKLYRQKDGLPFILCILTVVYGTLVKLIRQPLPDLNSFITSELGYVSPILLGLYIYINWRSYPQHREVIQKTFLWLVLVTSLYGIWQYFVAPPWDTHYMRVTWGEDSWMGKTEPLGIRVFSTTTHPFSFALNLVPGLILLNISNSKFRWISMSVGYLALLLTTYRTAWYTMILAYIFQFVSVKSNKQIHILASLILVILLIVLFANTEPFSTVILKRFETFSNIAEDGSGLERVEQLNRATSALMSEFIGYGNNGQEELSRANNYLLSGYDMGLYQYLACYGWIGSLVYGTGILLIIIKLCQNFPGKSDMFAVSARAIVFACIARVMTSSLLLYEFALPLWLFVGISMAAVKYHSNVQGSKLDISS